MKGEVDGRFNFTSHTTTPTIEREVPQYLNMHTKHEVSIQLKCYLYQQLRMRNNY